MNHLQRQKTVEDIRGFIKISTTFFTSGQPTVEQFADVQRAGVKLVINLAMPDSDYALSDERAIVESLDMEYHAIPVPFSSPTAGHYVAFERTLLAHTAVPVLVHCALNWRATSFAALFAERHLGWNAARADGLRSTLWTPNEVWNAWAHSIRALGSHLL